MGQDRPKCKETPSYSECHRFWIFAKVAIYTQRTGEPLKTFSCVSKLFFGFLHVNPFCVVYPPEGQTCDFLYILDDPSLLCATPYKVGHIR